MRAYLIDTPYKQIVEIDWDGDYKTIKNHLLIDGPYTVVRIGASMFDDVIFIDDEGLINGNPHGWFKINTYDQPLRGYGLVLGTDPEGESMEPNITLEALRARVTFYDDSELDPPESYANVEVYTGEEALRRMGML